ncbi:Crp/Fnr family transcriptional regulator [Rhizobium sp. AAP43]|nr:Crp/Fnr family transcriptional regulator [Rhizobium sp. AAP43]
MRALRAGKVSSPFICGGDDGLLANWAQHFPQYRYTIRNFRRGDVIAGAGVSGDMFARIQRGLVGANALLSDGREFIVEIMPKGSVVGEIEVLRRQPMNLEYKAVSDCELHFYDGRLLREMCAKDPNFQFQLLSRALARITELELRIIANAGGSLISRLAQTLLRLSAVYGIDGTDGDEVTISQHELAATLPASREKVNQCLRRLRESKVIDGTHGTIRILNRPALENHARSGGALA